MNKITKLPIHDDFNQHIFNGVTFRDPTHYKMQIIKTQSIRYFILGTQSIKTTKPQ